MGPKFLTQFLKLHSVSDTGESLLAIGRGTSEITRWKKKKDTSAAENDGLSLLS